MKKLTFAVLLTSAAFTVQAQTYVQPHVRSDGTFVQGHYRSAPDGSRFNNYSTQGNYNPYTGQRGTVNPYQYRPRTNYLNLQHNSGNSYLQQYQRQQRGY